MVEQSGKRLIDTLDNFLDGVFVLDKDWNFIYLNKRAATIAGLKPEDIVGKNMNLFPQVNGTVLEENYRSAMQTQQIKHLETKVAEYWFEITVYPSKEGILVNWHDISERKKAQEALQKSEERFSKVFSASPAAIVLTRLADGYFVDVNESFLRLLEYSRQEIIGHKSTEISMYINPNQRAELVKRLQEQGKIRNLEVNLQTRTGKPIWVLVSIDKINLNNDDYTIWTLVDITDRKKAEEKLTNVASFPTLYPNPIVEADVNCNISYLNPAAKTRFPNLEKLRAAHPFLADWQSIVKTFEGKTAGTFNREIKIAQHWYFQQVYLVPNSRCIRIYSATIDQLKETEEALKKAQQDLNLAQTVGRIGSWRLDIQRNVLIWSDENYRIFGVTKGKPMTYEAFLDIVHPQDRELVDQKWRASLKGEPYDIEHRIVVGDQIKWVREKAVLEFDENAVLLGGFGTTQEITDTVKLREQVEFYTKHLEELVEQKTKQLQDAERLSAIGQTAGMVGHDIRNPLQAVVGDLYLLEDDIEKIPDETTKQSAKETIEGINENIAYINKIIADLQDYARPLHPEYAEVDLSKLLVKVFENIAVPDSIKLSIKIKDLERLRVDPILLQRSLSNFVINAIQAMPKGGALEIIAHTEGNKAIVTVTDTGIGIPEEIKPKLFTPMMTTKSKGQGFGLAVSKRLIEAMKGTIRFESEKDKGTKFIIELPVNTQ